MPNKSLTKSANDATTTQGTRSPKKSEKPPRKNWKQHAFEQSQKKLQGIVNKSTGKVFKKWRYFSSENSNKLEELYKAKNKTTMKPRKDSPLTKLKQQQKEGKKQSKKSSSAFLKFRDELQAKKVQPNPKHTKSNSSDAQQSMSANRHYINKLLRSIKRRNMPRETHGQLKKTNLRRRLDFMLSQQPSKKKTVPKSHDSSLEEGELSTSFIESEPEAEENPKVIEISKTTKKTPSKADTSKDDDCICIEPVIEAIVIDDDDYEDDKADDDDDNVADSLDQDSLFRGKGSHLPISTSTPLGNHTLSDISDATLTNLSPSTLKENSLQGDLSLVSEYTESATNSPKQDAESIFFEDTRPSALSEILKKGKAAKYSTPVAPVGVESLYTRRPNGKQRMCSPINAETYQSAKKRRKTRVDEVILIEESAVFDLTSSSLKKKPKSQKLSDDSVIFVSETVAADPNFLPLETGNKDMFPVAKATNAQASKKNALSSRDNLFTNSEKKSLNAYNCNAYLPDVEPPTSKKRMIIIDGSNVAYGHGLSKEFSVKGLQICIKFFEQLGHDVKAVVPQFRLQKTKSTDPNALEALHKAGQIVFTPCKNLPGKSSSSYDDRFVLQLACSLDAAIISNDNYRDLLGENAAFKKIIENRVVGYTWCNDMFILPKDPYGRWGPSLQSILNRD